MRVVAGFALTVLLLDLAPDEAAVVVFVLLLRRRRLVLIGLGDLFEYDCCCSCWCEALFFDLFEPTISHWPSSSSFSFSSLSLLLLLLLVLLLLSTLFLLLNSSFL